LIQIVGRAARNVEGRVIFYADKVTKSMHEAITETNRRRQRQTAYNNDHGITPKTIIKALPADLRQFYGIDPTPQGLVGKEIPEVLEKLKIHNAADVEKVIRKKTKQMQKAAGRLAFEDAARLRDEVTMLKDLLLKCASDGPIGDIVGAFDESDS
jgi:excinuclease ABC subunit B